LIQTPSQFDVPLRDWGIVAQVAYADGKVWFPIRLLCAVLGVDAQSQIARMRDHAVLSQLMRQLPITTKTGTRPTWCIERRALGFWLGSIQVAGVRAELRARLLELQEALVDAADRLLFGEVAALQEVDTPATVASYARSLERRIGRLEEQVFAPEEDA
jgi:hypothetical protein